MNLDVWLIDPAFLRRPSAQRCVDFTANLLITPARWQAGALPKAETAETVSVWGVRSWKCRLALAFLCAQRARAFRAARIALLDLASVSFVEGVCARVPQNVKRKLVPRFLSEAEIEAGGAFWRAYRAGEPRGLPVWKLFPQRRQFIAFLESLRPRQEARGLRLSKLDTVLLGACARRPTSMVDLFTSSSAESLPARQFIHLAGDATLAHRLRAWSEAGTLRAVERDSPSWMMTRYELTAHGRSLLKRLPSLADLPPLSVGGA